MTSCLAWRKRFWIAAAAILVCGLPGCSDPEPVEPDRAPAGGLPAPVETGELPIAATDPSVPAGPVATPGPSVAGVVFGPDGWPRARVKVELRRVQSPWPSLRTKLLETSFTGDDGRFRFREPRGPDLRIVAWGHELARAEIAATPIDPSVSVHMTHGFSVEGVVEGPDGKPVANGTVILEPVAFSAQRALGTRTSRHGKFLFQDVPAGAARLTARSDFYRPVTLPSVEVGTVEVHRLRFPIDPAMELSGIVTTVGVDAEPIEGAVVLALPNAWNGGLFLPVEALTRADGRFDLPGLGPGTLHVQVRHPNHSTAARVVAVRDRNPLLHFELVPRSKVEGRLFGPPIRPGTRLEIAQAGELLERTVVEANGRFRFERKFSSGSAQLELLDSDLCFEQSGSWWRDVQLEEDATTQLDLVVVPAAMVRGVVQSLDGRLLEGVRVLWEQPRDALARLRVLAVTDAQGRYEVTGLPRNWLLDARFAYRCDGYAVGEASFEAPALGEALELPPVSLVRPGAISGRVTRSGRGIAGAVAFTGRGEGQREVTGPDGEFVLRDLRPGRYRVKARYGTMPLAVADETVEVTAGAEVGPIELALPAGRTINGRVVTPDGAPIDDALIVVRGMRGAAFYSGADGTFTLETPRQQVELQVFADPELIVQKTETVPLSRVGEVVIEMPMVPWGSVNAKVFGLPGPRPVAGGILRLEPLDGSSDVPDRHWQRKVLARWVAMSGGELRLLRFPAGHTRLTLQCPGFAPYVREVRVSREEVVDLGEILLGTGAKVLGVVTGADGLPIPRARVHLGDELDLVTAPPEAALFTDAAGRFTLHGVSADCATVVVNAAGYATLTRDLVIPDDLLRARPLELALDQGSTIAVLVENESTDKELNMVILRKSGQRVAAHPTDREGRVRFEHRSPGDYEISVLGESGAGQRVEVKGESRTYEVTIATGGKIE